MLVFVSDSILSVKCDLFELLCLLILSLMFDGDLSVRFNVILSNTVTAQYITQIEIDSMTKYNDNVKLFHPAIKMQTTAETKYPPETNFNSVHAIVTITLFGSKFVF